MDKSNKSVSAYKEELYDNMKILLTEIQNIMKTVDISQVDLDKFNEVIKNLENYKNACNEERMQYTETRIILKSEVEKLETKLQVKGLECQQFKDDSNRLNIKLEEIVKLRAKQFTTLQEQVKECMGSVTLEEIKMKLELIVKQINDFIEDKTAPSSIHNERQQQVFSTEQYQKELGQYSLSQRENILFNYMHQPGEHEDLGDVCLEDLLKITGRSERSLRKSNRKDVEKRNRIIRNINQRNRKLNRLLNCVSVVNNKNDASLSVEEVLDVCQESSNEVTNRLKLAEEKPYENIRAKLNVDYLPEESFKEPNINRLKKSFVYKSCSKNNEVNDINDNKSDSACQYKSAQKLRGKQELVNQSFVVNTNCRHNEVNVSINIVNPNNKMLNRQPAKLKFLKDSNRGKELGHYVMNAPREVKPLELKESHKIKEAETNIPPIHRKAIQHIVKRVKTHHIVMKEPTNVVQEQVADKVNLSLPIQILQQRKSMPYNDYGYKNKLLRKKM